MDWKILIAVAGMIFAGFILYLDYKERMEKIEKGLVDSERDMTKPALPGGAVLGSGLIISALGIAGMIGALILSFAGKAEAALYMLICFVPVLLIGCALLLYYRMLAPLRAKAEKAYDLQLESQQQKIESRRKGVGEEVIDENDLNV